MQSEEAGQTECNYNTAGYEISPENIQKPFNTKTNSRKNQELAKYDSYGMNKSMEYGNSKTGYRQRVNCRCVCQGTLMVVCGCACLPCILLGMEYYNNQDLQTYLLQKHSQRSEHQKIQTATGRSIAPKMSNKTDATNETNSTNEFTQQQKLKSKNQHSVLDAFSKMEEEK